MSITAYRDKAPSFGREVFIHPSAVVIGDVVVEDGASVWPGAVLRGDIERITIGARTSFQDNSVAHTDVGHPVVIGPRCVIGHGVIVHGAVVGEGCLIGMGSTLLNGAEIGPESIVGANSLVTQGKVFPPRSLIMGAPAKLVRAVTDDDLQTAIDLCERYARRAVDYNEAGLGADLSVG